MTGGVGTTFYRAPEQEGLPVSGKRSDNTYNLQADIYSLGIIIFEMFHPPFETVSEPPMSRLGHMLNLAA